MALAFCQFTLTMPCIVNREIDLNVLGSSFEYVILLTFFCFSKTVTQNSIINSYDYRQIAYAFTQNE